MEQKITHGGSRKGAGRKVNDRNYQISVKVSAEAKAVLDKQPNKAEYIDNLLKSQSV